MSTIYYDSSGHRYHKSHNNQSNGYVREGDSSGHVYSDPTHWTTHSSGSSSGSSSSSSSNNNSNVKTIDAKTTTREYNNGKVVIKDRNTGKILYEGSSANVKEVPGKIIVGSNVNPGGFKDEHIEHIVVKPQSHSKTQNNANDDQHIIEQAIHYPPIPQPKQDVVNPSISDDITPTVNTNINYFKDTGKKNEKGQEIWTVDYENPDVIQQVDTLWTENPVAKNIEKSKKSREKRLSEYNQKPGRKAVIEAENTIIKGGEEIGEFVGGHPGKIVGGAVGYAVAGTGELTTGAVQAVGSDIIDVGKKIKSGGKSKERIGNDVFNYLDTQVYSMEKMVGRPAEILLGSPIQDSDIEMAGAFIIPGAVSKGGKFAKTGKLNIGSHTVDVGMKNGYIALETTKPDTYSRKQLNWGNEKKATGERWFKEEYEKTENGEIYKRNSDIELYEYESMDTQRNKYIDVGLEKQTKDRVMPKIDENTKLEFLDSGKRGIKEKKVRNVNKKYDETIEFNEINLDDDAISKREKKYTHKNPHLLYEVEKTNIFDIENKRGEIREKIVSPNQGYSYLYEKEPGREMMRLDIEPDKPIKNFENEETEFALVLGKLEKPKYKYIKSVGEVDLPNNMVENVIYDETGQMKYMEKKSPMGIMWEKRGEFPYINIEKKTQKDVIFEDAPHKVKTIKFKKPEFEKPMKPWDLWGEEKPLKKGKPHKPNGKTQTTTKAKPADVEKQFRLEKMDIDHILDSKIKNIEKDILEKRNRVNMRRRSGIDIGYAVDRGVNFENMDKFAIDNKTKGKIKNNSKNTNKQRQNQNNILQTEYRFTEKLFQITKTTTKSKTKPKPEPIKEIPDIPPVIPPIMPKIRKKIKGKSGSNSNMYVGKSNKKSKKGRKNEKNLNLLDRIL